MDTTNINIEELSTADLKRLTAAANETIESRRSEEQAGAMGQIKALVDDNDLDIQSVMDFLSPKPVKTRKSNGTPKANVSKSPPKYRHTESGATWTGKGRKPEWIKSSTNPEQYLIPEAERTSTPAVKPVKAPKASKAETVNETPEADPTTSAGE